MLNDSTIIEDPVHDDMVGPDESEDNSLGRYRVGKEPSPLPLDEEGLERRFKIEEKIAKMTTFEIWRKRKGLPESYADVFDWEPERVHSEYLKLVGKGREWLTSLRETFWLGSSTAITPILTQCWIMN